MSWRAITAVLISAVGLPGCSRNYQGERLLWKAAHAAAPMMNDPRQATPERVAEAIDAFGKVIERARGTNWAAKAHLAMGALHTGQRQYQQARDAYGLVLLNYGQYRDACLHARMAIAKLHELEQDIQAAAKMYEEIAQHHPWSEAGLGAPLYIAHLFERRKEPAQARRAYERAQQHYTRLMDDAPLPEPAIRMKGLLALAYQRLGRQERTARLLEELGKETNGLTRPLALLTLGAAYQTLSDADRAAEAYAQLAEEFPEHPLGRAAKARLEHRGMATIAAGPGQ